MKSMNRLSKSLFSVVCVASLLTPRAALAEPEDLDSWKRLRSRHFVLSSDASAERAAEVLTSLELFRGAFALLSPDFSLRSPTPTEIVAFRDEESYRKYKIPADPRILGQFLQRVDGNYLTLNAGTRLTDAYAVVYHEYVHYLVQANLPGVPKWFNEGLAEYYSTFLIGEDEVVVGRPVERHVRWLLRDSETSGRSMSHDFSLEQVLTGEASHHSEKVGGFYAMSWALVHHLLSGDGERLDHLADFLARVGDGESAEEAFERAFDTRLESYETALREHARKGQYQETTFAIDALGVGFGVQVEALGAADTYFRLGDLLLQLNQSDRARSHLHRALELEGGHAEALAALAFLLDRESRFGEAEVLFDEAMTNGSSDARTFMRYGQHQLQLLSVPGKASLPADEEDSASRDRTNRAAAARKAFGRAIQIDPQFAGAHAAFGIAHLVGEVDARPGIESLRKAWQWLPGRDDLPLSLLRLYLKAERIEEARQVYRAAFSRHPETESAFRAIEEIDRAVLLAESARALEDGEVEEGLQLLDEAVTITTDGNLRRRLEERLIELQVYYGVR